MTENITPDEAQRSVEREERKHNIIVELVKVVREPARKVKDAILKAAQDLGEVPGVPKSRVASLIIAGLKEFEVDIHPAVVYKILPLEYKNQKISEASTEGAKQRKEENYDNRAKKAVTLFNYDLAWVPRYMPSTNVKLVIALHTKKIALEAQVKDLKIENEVLRRKIEELEAIQLAISQ